MIRIIEEKGEWRALLTSLENVDFYHTYDYHYLDKKENERPVLIQYSEGSALIALPLLIRPIPGTGYNDATSVYGYAGPIIKNIDDSFDNTGFWNELKQFLAQQKVISIFTRLNPFIPHQQECLKNIGETITLGPLVNIDITQDLETQRGQYQKRLRSYVSQGRKQCTIKKAIEPEDVNTFIEIYHETMLRIHAEPRYFFTSDYFQGLLHAEDFKSKILLASDNETGKAIAGVLYIKKGEIVQYHLTGTKAEFMHLNAVKLLIDAIRIEATQEGYTYLNLGGGVGSHEDSLFRFKNSFSKDLKPFQVWKYICDERVYEQLVTEKQSRPCASFHRDCTSYFPCYRCAV